MKHRIKSPSKIEKELGRFEFNEKEKSVPAVLMDTSALIDIERSLRDYALSKKQKVALNYRDVPSFLSVIDKKCPLIITPLVFGEIVKHSHLRLNGHTLEIEPRTFDYIEGQVANSGDFLARARTDVTLDNARYDTYWVSKKSCNGNAKKDCEGFSETDKEILTNAVRLSRSYIAFPEKANKVYNISPVVVFSSDTHMKEGVRFINEFLQSKYPQICNVSARY